MVKKTRKGKKANTPLKPNLRPYLPFNNFLARMVSEKKVSSGVLIEVLGRKTANIVLDNADNWMGAPILGASTAVILHGQLHEYAGAINDVKSRIANHWERLQNAYNKQLARQANLQNTPKPSSPTPTPEETLQNKPWPPRPKY